jgi:hypothetical protein
MTRNRLMVLLLIVLCGAITYAWFETPRQLKVAESGQSRTLSTDLVAQQLDIEPEIEDLDFSGGTDNKYQKPKKNLFATLYQPPKAVKRKPRKRKPKPKVVKVAPKVIQTKVLAKKPKGLPPLPSLKVLGYLGRAESKTVFLASGQGKIFLVKEGDHFFDELDVLEINDRNISIGRKRTGQQVSLKLGKTVSQRLPQLKIDSGRPKFSLPEPITNKKETSKPTDPRNLFRSKTEK